MLRQFVVFEDVEGDQRFREVPAATGQQGGLFKETDYPGTPCGLLVYEPGEDGPVGIAGLFWSDEAVAGAEETLRATETTCYYVATLSEQGLTLDEQVAKCRSGEWPVEE